MRFHLIRFCVEAAAERERSFLEKELLTSRDGEEELEEISQKLDFVNDFIASTDFPVLRAKWPELRGTPPMSVTVYRNDDGTFRIEKLDRPTPSGF